MNDTEHLYKWIVVFDAYNNQYGIDIRLLGIYSTEENADNAIELAWESDVKKPHSVHTLKAWKNLCTKFRVPVDYNCILTNMINESTLGISLGSYCE